MLTSVIFYVFNQLNFGIFQLDFVKVKKNECVVQATVSVFLY